MKRTGIALALAAVTAVAFAQGPGYGPGAGMMGGGPRMGGGPMTHDCPMMDGMMGGGPMMGGGAMMGGGPGMHRGGAGMPMLADLSDAQREQILAIREQHRRDTWDTMGQIRTEQFKLRRLHAADKVDPDAVVDQQKRIDELRLKMTRSRVVEHNEVLAVLTPEQRKVVRERGPGWMQGRGR